MRIGMRIEMRRGIAVMIAGAFLITLFGLVSGCGVKGLPRPPEKPIIKGL